MIRANRMISKPRPCYILTGLGSITRNNFISNIRLKMGKNQAKARQHPKTDLLTGKQNV